MENRERKNEFIWLLHEWETSRGNIILEYEDDTSDYKIVCFIPDSIYEDGDMITIVHGESQYRISLAPDIIYDDEEEHYIVKYEDNKDMFLTFI